MVADGSHSFIIMTGLADLNIASTILKLQSFPCSSRARAYLISLSSDGSCIRNYSVSPVRPGPARSAPEPMLTIES